MEEKLQPNISYDTETIKLEKTYKYFILKRCIDILGALIGIIILSPIMLITTIAIRLNSKGSVIFAQERVGLNEKMFKMYKFRSMVKTCTF